MVIKRITFWIAALVIAAGVWLLFFQSSSQKSTTLLPVETIQNEMRIIATPSTFSSDAPFKITVHLESFEHGDHTGINLLQTTLLTDDLNIPYLPTALEPISQDEYHQQAILVFEPLHRQPKSLLLSIFETEEHVFHWSL